MLLEWLTAREPSGPGWFQPGAQVLRLELPPDRTSPAVARAAIAASCLHWGLDQQVETAQLVVSELVTNVVVHASTPLLLAAEHDGPHLTIAVADGDIAPPVLADPEPGAEGGAEWHRRPGGRRVGCSAHDARQAGLGLHPRQARTDGLTAGDMPENSRDVRFTPDRPRG